MQTPENRPNAVPGRIPEVRWIHDYERCADLQQLKFVMEIIDLNQYQLISVTQDSDDIYTVFFRRCLLG